MNEYIDEKYEEKLIEREMLVDKFFGPFDHIFNANAYDLCEDFLNCN